MKHLDKNGDEISPPKPKSKPTPSPRPPQMSKQKNSDLCVWCNQPIKKVDRCADRTIVFFHKGYKNTEMHCIPFIALENKEERCPSCGVANGFHHHQGCPEEICPGCGGELQECDCPVIDNRKSPLFQTNIDNSPKPPRQQPESKPTPSPRPPMDNNQGDQSLHRHLEFKLTPGKQLKMEMAERIFRSYINLKEFQQNPIENLLEVSCDISEKIYNYFK